MKYIYLITSNYDSFFGDGVRLVSSRPGKPGYWNHAGLALSPSLSPMYTFGRRYNKDINKFGGFRTETLDTISGDINTLNIKVLKVKVTDAEYDYVKIRMDYLVDHIKNTHYNMGYIMTHIFKLPLPNNIPEDTNSVCSVFVSTIMNTINHPINTDDDTPINLITPDMIADSYMYNKEITVVYEGPASEYKVPLHENINVLLEGDIKNPRDVRPEGENACYSIKLTEDEKPYGIDLLDNVMSEHMYIITDIHIGDSGIERETNPLGEDTEDIWKTKCDQIIKSINETVSGMDSILCLGDLTGHHKNVNLSMIKYFLDSLYCKNFYLILGNNDYFSMQDYRKLGIKGVTDSYTWNNIVFSHYPLEVVPVGMVNIHGHLHSSNTYFGTEQFGHLKIWDPNFKPVKLKDINYTEHIMNPVKENDDRAFTSNGNYSGTNLLSLKKETIDDQLLRTMEKEFPSLSHILCNDSTKGYIYFDKSMNLVAIINVVQNSEFEYQIQNLTVSPSYKDSDLDSQLIDVAVRELKANKVTVNKRNEDLIKEYKRHGFRETGDSKISVTLERGRIATDVTESKHSELNDSDFGVPEERKYPLDTKEHVLSAIKLFNWVDDKYEEELAKNIKKKIKEYNISDKEIRITEKNRFYKYYAKPTN